jgi:uncharacterized Tic20 family protein
MIENDEKQARMWGMFCHLSALSGFIGIPFGSILGPLIIWLIKKNEYPFVDDQGKESLNFQISILIYSIVAALLIFVFIGIFLIFAIMITNIVLVIIASIKANNGEVYYYPYTIRFIK